MSRRKKITVGMYVRAKGFGPNVVILRVEHRTPGVVWASSQHTDGERRMGATTYKMHPREVRPAHPKEVERAIARDAKHLEWQLGYRKRCIAQGKVPGDPLVEDVDPPRDKMIRLSNGRWLGGRSPRDGEYSEVSEAEAENFTNAHARHVASVYPGATVISIDRKA